MKENEDLSVKTEELQQNQKEVEKRSVIWEPASGPDSTREEVQVPHIEVGDSVVAESALQIPSGLSFICILLPRFSDHYLMGDITDRLTIWMKEICISYGWRLESLAIRPGYLQWIMQVPLNANPARFMRVIRQHTSQRIFEEFPRLKQKNLSNEFWAPGNFVVAGNQLQTLEIINEWILQTRRQQGLV